MDLDMLEKQISSREKRCKLIASGAAVTAGIAAHFALRRGWKQVTDEEPPRDPGASDTDWDEAILWTVGSSIVIGLCRLAARRGAGALQKRR